MKKFVALLLAVLMVASLCACGQKDTQTASDIKTVTAGKLTMSTNAQFPPYESVADDGKGYEGTGFEGIDIEIAYALAQKLGLTPGDIRSALPYLWKSLQGGLRKTRQRLRIDPMQVSVILGGEEDPAASAETYGWISAAVWTFMPRLEELMRIPDPYIHLDVDYNARETRAEGEIGLFFQIRDLFAIGFAFGIPALKWLLRWKKEKKLREAAAQAEQAQTVQKTEETDGAKAPENDKKG